LLASPPSPFDLVAYATPKIRANATTGQVLSNYDSIQMLIYGTCEIGKASELQLL
jgi:hypothetical protein